MKKNQALFLLKEALKDFPEFRIEDDCAFSAIKIFCLVRHVNRYTGKESMRESAAKVSLKGSVELSGQSHPDIAGKLKDIPAFVSLIGSTIDDYRAPVRKNFEFFGAADEESW
jgi:hypothetical protein